jgi:hypothetical protein
VADAPSTRRVFLGRASEWRPGSRVARLHSSHSYGIVLALVVADVLFALLAPDGAWATSVLVLIETALLVIALWTSGLTRVGSHPMMAVVIVGVVTAVSGFLDRGKPAAAVSGLVAGVMVIAAIVVIALGVVDQREVNRQSIGGAISIYALFGLFFQFLLSVVAAIASSPLFSNGTDGTRAIRTYFSYITLATVGYGDYTPSHSAGRALAVFEALTGQLYLVIVLALLVGRLGQKGAGPRLDRGD